MLKEHPHKRTLLLLSGLMFLFGAARTAHGQIRSVSLENVGNSITCRIGNSIRTLTPDKFRIQFRGTSKETQEFFEAVAPHTDLTSYLYAIPVTDTPNVEICPADGGMNYIAYNANWLLSVYQDTNSKWTLYAIISHEVGHYVHAHDRRSVGSNHKIELVADEYAGEILAKMGATLLEVLAAYRSDKIGDHRGDDTHPPMSERLKSVEKGWLNIRETKPSTEGSSGGGKKSDRKRDPSKDEGAFGDNIYEFWYVSFSYDSNGKGTPGNQENKRYTVKQKPQIGEHYVWRGQSWKVYAIAGSRVWLASLDPSNDEGAFGHNIYEFWYVSDADKVSERYTVKQKPQIGEHYVWRNQNWKVYAVTGSRVWLTKIS